MPVTDSNRVSPINHVPNLLCQFSEVFRAFACVLTGSLFLCLRRMNGGRRVYMIPVALRTINTTPRKSTASLPGVPNNSPLCSSQMVRNKEVLGE